MARLKYVCNCCGFRNSDSTIRIGVARGAAGEWAGPLEASVV